MRHAVFALVLFVVVSARTLKKRECGVYIWSGWSGWSGWSECSDYGQKQRVRYCISGCCDGDTSEITDCEKKKKEITWTWPSGPWYAYGYGCQSFALIAGKECCCQYTASGFSCTPKKT